MALVMGIVFMAVGIAGMLFVGRRKFYRRNEAGVEEYGSYKSALANAAMNKIVSLVSAICFVIGVAITVVFFAR